jgi:hypothetical protein
MIHLGIMHERGDSVPLDETRAKDLFTRAGVIYGNKRAQRAISSLRELYPESGPPLIQQSA